MKTTSKINGYNLKSLDNWLYSFGTYNSYGYSYGSEFGFGYDNSCGSDNDSGYSFCFGYG